MPFSTGTLTERRAQLEALLNDPAFDGDSPALVAEADAVLSEIRVENEAREQREAARNRLSVLPAAIEPAPTETRANGLPTNPHAIAADFATRMDGYSGGKQGHQYSLDVRSVILTDGATQGTPFTPLVPQPGIIQVAQNRPLKLADLISRGVTGVPVIEYIRDTTATPQGNAAFVADGGASPESTYTFDLVSDTVKQVSHFVNISRSAAADHAQMESYIEQQGLYALAYCVDDAIANGSGVGVNMRGILSTSGINLYDPSNAATPYTEARLISLRRAMTPIYTSYYAPTAVVLNPNDWQWIELSRSSTGDFRVSPSVQDELSPRIWGLPVVQTTTLSAGTGLVGDFQLGAKLWDLQQATIYMTDSHASNFTSNVLTLEFLLRLGLSIHRLGAFTKTAFNPGAAQEAM